MGKLFCFISGIVVGAAIVVQQMENEKLKAVVAAKDAEVEQSSEVKTETATTETTVEA